MYVIYKYVNLPLHSVKHQNHSHLLQESIKINQLQWIPVIRTPLGVGKYILINSINYTVDMRTVSRRWFLYPECS